MENETQVDTQTTEITEEASAVVAPEEEVPAEAEDNAVERPKLSETEQLAIHRRQITKLEKKLGIYQSKEQPKTEPRKPNEPDYARLTRIAYYKSIGIDHPEDQKFAWDEAERLKLPPDEVVGMEHVKNRLQANKDARTAQTGMPKGTRRSGGTTQADVDYWLSKGETPDDQELAEKVVDARLAKEKSNKFSDELYVG